MWALYNFTVTKILWCGAKPVNFPETSQQGKGTVLGPAKLALGLCKKTQLFPELCHKLRKAGAIISLGSNNFHMPRVPKLCDSSATANVRDKFTKYRQF